MFSACGDGGSFDKCNSNKCILKNSSFKKTDKILSSVTRRTYSYGNYENSYVKCNLCNIIYLIRCSNCFMQYVGETAQQLNITFATSRASMSGEMKLNCCKWLTKHFSTRICKNVKYSVKFIKKLQGNGRIICGTIDIGETLLRRKGETEWMLNLRTVYSYGLNEKVW